MHVNSVNSYNSLNFRAQKIAKAKNCYKGLTTHIDIYRLNESDNNFLKKLLDSIDLKRLLPDISNDKLKLYQDVFRAGIFNAMDSMNTAYIAMSNNTPCALLALQPGKTTNFLDLVSIPIDKNKKVNWASQTLLYQAFLDSKNANSNTIKLEAVKDSFGNPVKKYKEWGLEAISEGDKYVEMHCNRPNITRQLERFSEKIGYKKVKQKNINIEKFVN